jgi:hypothetical protein
MDDIISISVNNIYQSRKRERDCGLPNYTNVMDKFITAYDNKFNGNASNYDALILKLLPRSTISKKRIYMKDCFIYLSFCLIAYGRKCFGVIWNDKWEEEGLMSFDVKN